MNTLVSQLPHRRAWLDRCGIWVSVGCVVHCLITPVLLSMSVVFVHFLPSEEWIHRSLAVVIAALGGLALVSGYRLHRRSLVIYLMISGVATVTFAACFGDSFGSHWVEVAVTLAGSVQMITAHRMNHTFCRNCKCVDASCGDDRPASFPLHPAETKHPQVPR